MQHPFELLARRDRQQRRLLASGQSERDVRREVVFVGEEPGKAAFIGGAIIIGAVVISIAGGRWIARNGN